MMGLLVAALTSAAGALPPPPIIVTPSSPTWRAQEGTGATRARAHLPGLFSRDDYPAQALRNGEQGTTAVQLAIAADGRVTGCSVTSSSGSPSLDAATCNIIQRRARFSPARDVQGSAIADSNTARIRWVLPPRPAVPWADTHAVVAFTINGSRQITECIAKVSVPIIDRGTNCEALSLQARHIVARIPPNTPLQGRQLVFETALMVGEPTPMVGERELELMRIKTEVTVAADGTTAACTVILDHHGTDKGRISPCQHDMRFEPIAATAASREARYATIRRALYIRRP